VNIHKNSSEKSKLENSTTSRKISNKKQERSRPCKRVLLDRERRGKKILDRETQCTKILDRESWCKIILDRLTNWIMIATGTKVMLFTNYRKFWKEVIANA
jgi:hypothetical protein